jgi:hypothetical protein
MPRGRTKRPFLSLNILFVGVIATPSLSLCMVLKTHAAARLRENSLTGGRSFNLLAANNRYSEDRKIS